MLMTVIARQGSSPGKTGFKMAVAADGSITGSIGGGVMEYKLVEKSKKMLSEEGDIKPFILLQDHDPEATTNRSGMICSGGQTIAFIPLTDRDLSVVAVILKSIQEQEKGVFELSEKGLFFFPDKILSQHIITEIVAEGHWKYQEQTGMPNSLYIFGGGHVGLALSRLFSNMDFQIYVFDNRSELNTLEENHFAHSKQIVDYNKVRNLVSEGHNIYVVVMTFAHKSDEQVLKQMLDKNIRYLGMMGSEMKVNTIFEHLRHDGFTQQVLDKVYAPIGLPINSENPTEIAISIAAQIIAVKNSEAKNKRPKTK